MAMVTIIINRMKRVISPIIMFLFSILPSFLPRKCRGAPEGTPREGRSRSNYNIQMPYVLWEFSTTVKHVATRL